ncbi:caspase-8 isoform X1 [Paramuricea clavata]|uniref:Caspase-8 isoform X1 n=1 Tax=Paramuricea clavata TaxID=317549 RepID=A0A7D9L0N6_PARCT|nr:caspase-8 isoform X1 [Paramuricea clavata]
MVDTFKRLLYDISKRLSKEEVIDLVYLCKVPQSAQTKIQDGKDLFKYLEETGVINEQKIHTLKKVLYLLRPKRQDLLDLVDRKFPEDDNRSNRSISICTTNTINTVKSDTRKPKTVHTYLNANEYRKDIGFIVVSVLSFLLIIVIFPYLIRKHGPKIFTWCNRKGRETRERRRSLRNERQLLRESQAVLSLSEQSSRNSAAKLKVDNYPSDQRTHENSVLDIEAQRPGNQIQSI